MKTVEVGDRVRVVKTSGKCFWEGSRLISLGREGYVTEIVYENKKRGRQWARVLWVHRTKKGKLHQMGKSKIPSSWLDVVKRES